MRNDRYYSHHDETHMSFQHDAVRSLALGVFALVAGRQAGAQRPDTATLAPVVVTATRTPISSLAVPATVDVISGDELRLRGTTSLASALQSVAGITIAQSGSFGGSTSIFLRGGESKYTKVLIDGVPVNDPGGAIDLSTLTTDNVERIEVVRGPTSVLYGADAVSGVIQIFTRRGEGAPHVLVTARAGSYGTTDADGTVLGTLGNGDFSVGIARHDTKGIYAFNNAFRNTVASAGLHLALDPSTTLRADVRYGDDLFHYPTDGGGTVSDSNANTSQDRTTLAVELARTFAERLDAHLTVTSEATSGGTDDQPDTPTSSGTESLDRTRRRAADLRANLSLPGATVLTAGGAVEQEDERTESQFVFSGSGSSSIFTATRRNKAAYVQGISSLPDSVVVTAGGRLDDNERFGNFGTYRVGANWRVAPGLHLRGSLGTAFREPTFFENYSTGFVTGNPALSPERTVGWEIGLRQALWHDRIEAGVTQFDQRFRNLIDYTGSTNACGASYCNVARARSVGRELELRVLPVARLALDANLTHLETKVLTAGFDSSSGGLYHQGEQLIRRPTTSWNLGASYVSPFAGIDVRLIHVGERTDRDFRPFPALPVVDPAYTRTDLGAELPLDRIAPHFTGAALTLHVENLFDTNYQSVFNFLSPRRTILVGARARF